MQGGGVCSGTDIGTWGEGGRAVLWGKSGFFFHVG